MRVKILKDDPRFGIKAGDVFSAERYRYDPQEKVTLLHRDGDGYDPQCNQYISEVAMWIAGQWMIVEGGRYVPEDPRTRC